jgi:hypothetical protein
VGGAVVRPERLIFSNFFTAAIPLPTNHPQTVHDKSREPRDSPATPG